MSCLHVEFKGAFPVPRSNGSHNAIPDPRSIYRPGSYPPVLLDRDLNAAFRELEALLAGQFPSVKTIDRDYIVKECRLFTHFEQYFLQIFETAQSRIGFVSCYTSARGVGFISACHRFGFPSVAVQHGAAAHINPACAPWPRVPKKGYPYLPDVFWCWDKGGARMVEEWIPSDCTKHRAFAGGDLWLRKLARKASDRKMTPPETARSGGRTVLWVQQGQLPDDLEFMTRAPRNWCWWIRLHPLFLHLREPLLEMLSAAGVTNFLMDELTDSPMADLFTGADVLLTMFSTAVLEAIPYRLFSVVTSDMGQRIFPAQVADGSVRVALAAEDVVRCLEEQARKKGADIGMDELPDDPLGDLYSMLGLKMDRAGERDRA